MPSAFRMGTPPMLASSLAAATLASHRPCESTALNLASARPATAAGCPRLGRRGAGRLPGARLARPRRAGASRRGRGVRATPRGGGRRRQRGPPDGAAPHDPHRRRRRADRADDRTAPAVGGDEALHRRGGAALTDRRLRRRAGSSLPTGPTWPIENGPPRQEGWPPGRPVSQRVQAEVDDTYFAGLTFANGAIGQLMWSWAGRGAPRRCWSSQRAGSGHSWRRCRWGGCGASAPRGKNACTRWACAPTSPTSTTGWPPSTSSSASPALSFWMSACGVPARWRRAPYPSALR